MYNVIILSPAKKDILKAAGWYHAKQYQLGKRFLKEVRKKVLLIRQSPKISAIRYNEIRTTVLDVFPFMIHYTIDEERKIVIIAAIFHTSLNPEMWKSR